MLSVKDYDYLEKHGISEIIDHAHKFILDRLSPAYPINDGKQTPFKNHPVFVAQHATATCCRKCMNKWYKIVILIILLQLAFKGFKEIKKKNEY